MSDYNFTFGVVVGMLGLFLFIKLMDVVDKWVTRHVERKIQKQIDEHAERVKRIVMEEAIKRLEDHANWKDE